MARLSKFIHDNTWLVILLAVTVGLIFPTPGNVLKPHLNLLLAVLTFLSCLDLNIGKILEGFTDIKSQSLSLLIVHLVAPIIIFVLRDSFPPEIYLGLIIAATIPAGRSAVFLCSLYGGNPIKALLTSSISNALAPIVVPSLVWLFAHTTVKIDVVSMGSTIFFLVIIPLIAAFFFGRTSLGIKLNHHSPSVSTLILFLIILGILSPIRPIIAQNLELTVMLVLITMALSTIDFIFGYTFPKNGIDKITYGISSSYKNYTLGTLLSLSLFNPIVALPSVAYTIANNLLLIPLQFFLRRRPADLKPNFHHHRRHNILLLCSGIIFSLLLSRLPIFDQILSQLGKFSYLSAFIAGSLFASTFTFTTGFIILLKLLPQIPLVNLIFCANLGAVLTDFTVFQLVKNTAHQHVSPVFQKFLHRHHLYRLFHTPYFAWSLPVIGAVIMATPLPDEIGVSLLGLSQLKLINFLAISYISHTIGITALLLGTSML